MFITIISCSDCAAVMSSTYWYYLSFMCSTSTIFYLFILTISSPQPTNLSCSSSSTTTYSEFINCTTFMTLSTSLITPFAIFIVKFLSIHTLITLSILAVAHFAASGIYYLLKLGISVCGVVVNYCEVMVIDWSHYASWWCWMPAICQTP